MTLFTRFIKSNLFRELDDSAVINGRHIYVATEELVDQSRIIGCSHRVEAGTADLMIEGSY